MIDDVAYSRNYLGLHYATDNDFAYQVAQEILKNNDFRNSIEEEVIPQIKKNNLYDLNKIIKIWNNIDKSSSSELELLFTIIVFEIWLKKFRVSIN